MDGMVRRFCATVLSLVCLVCLAGLASAETEDAAESADTSGDSEHTIAPDRPGAGDGTSIVPPSRLQLEAGASLEVAEVQAAIEPVTAMARLGLTDNLEARLSTTPLRVGVPFGGETTTSLLPSATLGVKAAGRVSDRLRLGLLPSVTAGRTVTDQIYWVAGGHGIAELDVSEAVGLGLNLGADAAPGPDGGRTLRMRGTTSIGLSPSGPVGTYAEYFATYVPAVDGTEGVAALSHGVGAGATYLVDSTLQLDVFFDVTGPQLGTVTAGFGVSFLP